MDKKFHCKICSSSKGTLLVNNVRDSKNYSVFECNKCKHVQLYPLPDWSNNKKYYDNNSQASWVRSNIDLEKTKKLLMFDTNRRADLVSSICNKTDKILEIGTGYGFFMEEMLNRGVEIDGIEISNSRRLVAEKTTKKKLYEVDICQTESIPQYFYNKFNIVLAFQVF